MLTPHQDPQFGQFWAPGGPKSVNFTPMFAHFLRKCHKTRGKLEKSEVFGLSTKGIGKPTTPSLSNSKWGVQPQSKMPSLLGLGREVDVKVCGEWVDSRHHPHTHSFLAPRLADQ